MRDRHILYVISRYTYRSTFIVREIAELAARGWSITVVSLRRPSFAPGSDPGDLPYTVAYDRFLAANVLRRRDQGLRIEPAGHLSVRPADRIHLRQRSAPARAQPRRHSQGLLLCERRSPVGMPAHPRPLGDGVDVGGDADLALVRRALFLHRPRLGHFLRHAAPGREGRGRPVRPDLHRLQPAASGADGEDRQQQGPRALPRTAHSQSIGGARRLRSGVRWSS